jgi:hypothetical protein
VQCVGLCVPNLPGAQILGHPKKESEPDLLHFIILAVPLTPQLKNKYKGIVKKKFPVLDLFLVMPQ